MWINKQISDRLVVGEQKSRLTAGGGGGWRTWKDHAKEKNKEKGKKKTVPKEYSRKGGKSLWNGMKVLCRPILSGKTYFGIKSWYWEGDA